MSNSFFENFGLGGLFPTGDVSFFNNTDVKTILGRNLVKNFVCKIKLELQTLGYSDTALEIAEFYNSCRKSGGIIKFVSNPVIKMILNEIENMPSVKSWLQDRIFDDIEVEKAENLDKIFNNNDELYEQTQHKEHEYKVNKELRRKEILKIQKEKNCSFEEAEKIYEQRHADKQKSAKEDSLIKDLNSFLSKANSLLDIPSTFDLLNNSQEPIQDGSQANVNTGDKQKRISGKAKKDDTNSIEPPTTTNTNTVSLDDDIKDDGATSDNDNFWFS